MNHSPAERNIETVKYKKNNSVLDLVTINFWYSVGFGTNIVGCEHCICRYIKDYINFNDKVTLLTILYSYTYISIISTLFVEDIIEKSNQYILHITVT